MYRLTDDERDTINTVVLAVQSIERMHHPSCDLSIQWDQLRQTEELGIVRVFVTWDEKYEDFDPHPILEVIGKEINAYVNGDYQVASDDNYVDIFLY